MALPRTNIVREILVILKTAKDAAEWADEGWVKQEDLLVGLTQPRSRRIEWQSHVAGVLYTMGKYMTLVDRVKHHYWYQHRITSVGLKWLVECGDGKATLKVIAGLEEDVVRLTAVAGAAEWLSERAKRDDVALRASLCEMCQCRTSHLQGCTCCRDE